MEQLPICFGKEWNPQAVECKGGLDPMYTNPRDQSHRRDKCRFYERCAPRTCANQISQSPTTSLVPAQNLVPRNGPQVASPVVQPQARQQPVYYPQAYAPPPPPPAPTAGFAQMGHPSMQMAPAHIAQFGPQMLATNFQQPGTQIPAYLTVPEPVDLSVPWYMRLGREILRAMAKGAFHTGANWVDHNPFGQYKPPG